jgi:hypothetical protein
MYAQQEMVKDLVADRLDASESLVFEAGDVRLRGLDTDRPTVHYRHEGSSGRCPATSSPAATASTVCAAFCEAYVGLLLPARALAGGPSGCARQLVAG